MHGAFLLIYTLSPHCSLPLINTFMLPSADPVTKYSSVGSTAIALTGESWLWSNCCCCFWRRSIIHVKPFLPPEIKSWCFGAYARTVAPLSWQMKAESQSNLNKYTVLMLIWHECLIVQHSNNSGFEAIIQLTTASLLNAVQYMYLKLSLHQTSWGCTIAKWSSYNLYGGKIIPFFLPLCNHKLLSLDRKQVLFKFSNNYYLKAYFLYKMSSWITWPDILWQ